MPYDDYTRSRDYTQREIRFALAHWEELVTLDESDAARDLREALKHEQANLPEGLVCTCDVATTMPEAADGSAGGAGRWRTPSATLGDIKRAIAALPNSSLFRTKLYLMTTPVHDWRVKHTGERCDLNYYGEQNGVLGHLVYLNETQVYGMPKPEFEARHRRRMALTGFLAPARVQDAWDVRDGYRYLADYLNLGETEFLATWTDHMTRRVQVAA